MTAADPTGVAAPEVPESLDALLEPAWLTAALGARFPGVQVVGVTPGPVVERISTNARFRIECDGDLPDGLVPTLCAKGYFSELGRALAHVGEPEARFYRDLADATGVHTLRSVYADVHPGTRHGVVITEDVIEAGGTFLDALSPYSPDQVARSLEELARLHGATWGDTALASEPWLASRLQTYFEQRGEKEIRQNFDGPPGRELPRRRARPRTAPRRVPYPRGAPAGRRVGGHPRRRARRQPLSRRRRASGPRRLAAGPARPLVHRRRLPHRVRPRTGGAARAPSATSSPTTSTRSRATASIHPTSTPRGPSTAGVPPTASSCGRSRCTSTPTSSRRSSAASASRSTTSTPSACWRCERSAPLRGASAQ